MTERRTWNAPAAQALVTSEHVTWMITDTPYLVDSLNDRAFAVQHLPIDTGLLVTTSDELKMVARLVAHALIRPYQRQRASA